MNTTTRTTTNPPPVSRLRFYAVKWPRGVVGNASTGRPFRRVARFTSAAARDAWCYEGNPYRTSPGYREPVSRAEVDSEIRRSVQWEADPETGIEYLL